MSVVNQITGCGFVDSSGNPLSNGYLLFKLNSDGIVNTNTKICQGYTIKVPLDNSGCVVTSPAYSLWPNDVLTPANTYYLVSLYNAEGELVWGPSPQLILSTPSPFNVSVWVPGKIF